MKQQVRNPNWKAESKAMDALARRHLVHTGERKAGMKLKFSKGEYVAQADGSLRRTR